MKEKPILFSAPMVKALLAGTKTQTRRVVKWPKDTRSLAWSPDSELCSAGDFSWVPMLGSGDEEAIAECRRNQHLLIPMCHPDDRRAMEWKGCGRERIHCPYGQPGDRLVVKETWRGEQTYDDVKPSEYNKVSPIWYEADGAEGRLVSPDGNDKKGRIRQSIFMPLWMSRITLEITEVRVRRLQDISEEDILAEGLTKDLIKSLVTPSALRCKELPEHWIHGNDHEEGTSYCYKCAKKEVDRLNKEEPGAEDYIVDGGWGSEGDSTPFCETCGARLSAAMTDYCAEMEFEHSLENGCNLKSPDDCCSLLGALDATPKQYYDFPRDPEHKKQKQRDRIALMHRVGFRVLWESINGPGSWALNPWVWVISFTRL